MIDIAIGLITEYSFQNIDLQIEEKRIVIKNELGYLLVKDRFPTGARITFDDYEEYGAGINAQYWEQSYFERDLRACLDKMGVKKQEDVAAICN